MYLKNRIQLEKVLDSPLWTMFQELGRAAEKGNTGSAILLDELQLANRDDVEAFVAAVHRATQLKERDARDALLLPAHGEGVEYDDKAAEMLLERAGGYPYFIARSMGYTNVRAASSLRASLIDKGVLYSVGRGRLEFTVPRFAEFMRGADASVDAVTSAS